MVSMAAGSRAVTYTGIVRMKDGRGSGGYTIVQSSAPDAMEAYEEYNREKFKNVMILEKLNHNLFACYLPGLPYEFGSAKNQDIAVNADDVFGMYDSKGQPQLAVRREKRGVCLFFLGFHAFQRSRERGRGGCRIGQKFPDPSERGRRGG